MATWFKRKVIRPVRNRILYIMVYSVFKMGPLMSRRILLAWHKWACKYIYLMCKKTAAIMNDNFTRVFGPERYKDQYKQLGLRVFQNLTLTFTDYALWGFKRNWKFFSKYFTVKGEEHLRRAYNRGKGVLCLVTHTPGWEFSAFMPPQLGYKSAGVSSAIKNPALNKFMIMLRETRGMRNITRHRCYEQLVELLRNGECLIIMTDQDSMHIRGEFVDFMGSSAYTPIGCSRLAAETGAAVVPMCTLRNADNTYTFLIQPEIPPIYDSEGRYDIIANTQAQNDAMSHIIYNNPDQWVWFHERWKTTPESLANYLEQKRKAEELQKKSQSN